MDLGRLLIDLILLDHEVSVPGLGTFTLTYLPAEVYKFTNRISPPSQKLIFTASKETAGTRFIDFITEKKNSEQIEIAEAIKNWVDLIYATTDKGEKFEITELGLFKKDGDKLIFDPIKNNLLFADSFGLESVNIPLFEIEGPVTSEPTKPVAKPDVKLIVKPINKPKPIKLQHMKKWIIIAGSAVLLIVAIVFLYQKGMLQSGFEKLSGLFKSHKSSLTQMATNDTLNGKIDANDLKRKALSYEESQKAMKDVESKLPDNEKVIKYYIIAGSFKSIANAQKFESKLKNSGYNPVIVEMSDTLYRVALNSFTDRHKAVEEFIMLTNKDTSIKIWLYSQLASN